jgi:hypothetical protein
MNKLRSRGDSNRLSMPNGNSKFAEEARPEFEAFFLPIGDTLEEFAFKHSLRLVKYYHDAPSWRFNFTHPKGGAASVDVMKESSDELKIYQYWWIDSFSKFTRSIKTSESELLNRDLITLDLLRNKLTEILGWKLDEWTEIASGYEEYWKPYGKELLEVKLEQFPMPRI